MAEKTGYPEDMLDLDLDLEADLGVDTVKQAEMFAAVRAAYNIPRDENLKLRDFPTLAHVIKFAHDRSALWRQASVPSVKTEPSGTEASGPCCSVSIQPVRPVLASLDAANRIPRRVPVPTLRPPLTFCKVTGVKLDATAASYSCRTKVALAKALTKRLETMGVEVLRIDGAPDADTLTGILKSLDCSRRQSTESTGCPRSTTKETFANSISHRLARSLAGASEIAVRHDACSCMSTWRAQARSWYRQRGSADSMATTTREQLLRSAAP